MKLAAALLALASGLSAQAATITASSASMTAVNSAIAAAADGDTVQIPAGTATWSASVSVSKPITILGAGTNATIITGQPHCFDVSLPSGKTGRLVRISNMRLNGSYDPTSNGDYIIYANGNLTALRVDHVWFHGGMQAVEAGDIGSWAYGVIDHCVFEDPCIGVRPQGGNTYGWAAPVVPGTTNCICIEDNLFFFTANANHSLYNGSWPQEMIYHQWGARSVIRNNVFDASALTSTSNGADATWCDIIDAHGNQGYGMSQSVEQGTVIVECYSNVFKCDRTGIFANLRGGCQMWYSNRFVNVSTSSAEEYMRLNEEETWQTSFFSPLDTTWPCQEQITNSFFWANTYNGSPCSPDVYSAASPVIQQGRDYWLQPPSAGNGLPTGVYATYKPLAYPHPLVSGVVQGPVTNPVISVSTSSLSYGAVPVGSTNDLTLTVQNVGGGTLSGSCSVAAPFTIVGSSSYSLASNASRTITVRYAPSSAGSSSQTLSFTGGGGASVSVSGSALAVLGLSFDSTVGAITAPFAVNSDNTISQNAETTDPTTGGQATYYFSVQKAGNYQIAANVYAPDASANSIFINIDSQPTSPAMIWDLAINTSLASQVVAWNDSPTPQVWSLSAGIHQLIIRGREAGVEIGHITISSTTNPSPPTNLRVVAGGG